MQYGFFKFFRVGVLMFGGDQTALLLDDARESKMRSGQACQGEAG